MCGKPINIFLLLAGINERGSSGRRVVQLSGPLLACVMACLFVLCREAGVTSTGMAARGYVACGGDDATAAAAAHATAACRLLWLQALLVTGMARMAI